jgi:hypothetical protein
VSSLLVYTAPQASCHICFAVQLCYLHFQHSSAILTDTSALWHAPHSLYAAGDAIMQIMATALGDESVRLKQWSKGEYTGANNVSRTLHTHSVTRHHLVDRSQLGHERTLQMQRQLSGAAFLYEAAAAACGVCCMLAESRRPCAATVACSWVQAQLPGGLSAAAKRCASPRHYLKINMTHSLQITPATT